jgi:poly-gamma-glutamate system protein
VLLAGRSATIPAGPAADATGRTTIPADLARRAAFAEETMRRAEDVIRTAKQRDRIESEAEAGIDRSGLIGSEVTPLMTTLGSLEAKRISTNPAWARVLTERLSAVGVGRGDLVTASFSGSFPGLDLAVACACKALGADLAAVSSVTASTWGATQPGFTWPEMEARLVDAGVISRASIAVTAGGEADMALDLEPDGRAMAWQTLEHSARHLGVPTLRPRDFADAVRQRMDAYRRIANGRPVKLYVNVGGASASLGRSSEILRLRSGFIPPGPFDRSVDRGVTARMAEQGVRVLMLLNIRDLALGWGVPLTGRQ